MANRSYLFAADLLPEKGTPNYRERRQIGISEWNYEIPLAYKLLVSVNTQKCYSSIFQTEEQVALAGDFDAGVERLLAFLKQIKDPKIASLADEAGQFLCSPDNRRKYLLLECGEIFDMNEPSSEEQNEALLQEIRQPAQRVAIGNHATRPAPPPGFFGRLFGRKTGVAPLSLDVNSLGLGNWSNALYFDVSEDEPG